MKGAQASLAAAQLQLGNIRFTDIGVSSQIDLPPTAHNPVVPYAFSHKDADVLGHESIVESA